MEEPDSRKRKDAQPESPTNNKKAREVERKFEIKDVVFCKDTNDPVLIEELTCGICLSVIIDPHMFPCQHAFCNRCIVAIGTSSSFLEDTTMHCPSCRKSYCGSEVVRCMAMCRMVDALWVACLYDRCMWKGRFSELSSHLSDCQFLSRCRCGSIVETERLSDHEASCPMVASKCNCGQMVPVKEKDEHVQKHCPNTWIACSFEEYGCVWKGTRAEFDAFHSTRCKTGQLWEECEKLRTRLNSEAALLPSFYRSSDAVLCTGFTDRNPERRALIHRFARSRMDLGFPVTIGGVESKEVEICAISNDSIFEMSVRNFENGCQVDLDQHQGVACITFGEKKDRLFIFPLRGEPVSVSKSNGRICVEFPPPIPDKVCPAIVVHANRRWLRFSDGSEYPFTIEPAHRHFRKFSFRFSNKETGEALYRSLAAFFSAQV